MTVEYIIHDKQLAMQIRQIAMTHFVPNAAPIPSPTTLSVEASKEIGVDLHSHVNL